MRGGDGQLHQRPLSVPRPLGTSGAPLNIFCPVEAPSAEADGHRQADEHVADEIVEVQQGD